MPKHSIGYLVKISKLVSGAIAGAVVRGIIAYLRQLLSRSRQHINSTEAIRLQLGRVLALGLEFTVASNILRTDVALTRQDILNLGVIVLLRTLLNYFLEREIRQVEQSRLKAQENTPSLGEYPMRQQGSAFPHNRD